ncbi:MAG: glycosyltransferase family 2 protein [Aulosira sp. ZfuVER01]|nr:glycosyltransferase family 2 protein [Aulosira sp. ZfuVER01]MDZ7997362.1 glycosyltransferase family 2 protein [Aulosira sp. DedVER01a]MDZ8054194.1 glycosyltransferase family 2 protein [Aulosira sp. ZfuCHP01]
MNTTVVFIIFNRPDITAKVFEVIRQVKPAKLLVIADGYRSDFPDDVEQCAATRKIIEQVDWDCKILKNYAEKNLGAKIRIATGLNWVFQQVEEAIILEDDCLPHPTFFAYCEELLDKYRHDQRIMTISGNNFQFGRRRTEDSYYFSRYPLIWGWATWRRAWQQYDLDMKQWVAIKNNNWLQDILNDSTAVRYWTEIFQTCYEGKINTWDYPWTLTSWLQNGLNILPNVNLVSNIGFSTGAANTKDIYSPFANHPAQAMEFPLQHPEFMIRDAQADKFTQQTQFHLSLIYRLKRKIKQILHKSYFRLLKTS